MARIGVYLLDNRKKCGIIKKLYVIYAQSARVGVKIKIRRTTMKEGIHPEYHTVNVICACGHTFQTGTTKKCDELRVEICSKCHPYFTGKQKLVDTGGRVDKFKKRYNLD